MSEQLDCENDIKLAKEGLRDVGRNLSGHPEVATDSSSTEVREWLRDHRNERFHAMLAERVVGELDLTEPEIEPDGPEFD